MLKKEDLAQIILDFQKGELPELITRELQVALEIPIKRTISILGPRRSGKTYYLYFLIKKLLKSGIKRERILYLNFENPNLFDLSLKDLPKILEVFYELYPQNKSQKIWLFFDEIQNIKDWEVFVRSILDKEKAQVFISGSSSRLLSREIATSLRGRTLSYLLLPFSFREVLKAKNVPYQKYLSSKEQAQILNVFEEYFSYGGYPENVIYPQERKRIINEIIEVTIHRDLIERYGIRNIKVIKIMFNYLLKAKEFSIHKFYFFLKSLNIKVSKNSLYNYLEYFNDAFIFFPLRRFSYSLKRMEQSAPKIYSVDNGFIESLVGNDKSKKFENLVFLSLLQKGLEPNKDFFYYSLNGGEVDFVLKKGTKISRLIQACFEIDDFTTKEREVKSLLKASQQLGCANLLVITSDLAGKQRVKGKNIKFIPLWQWLLEK